MPNKPRADNPARAVRIEDELWAKLQAIAAARGVTMSAVIRDALDRYVKGTP